jgi:putative ABC transport system permease protein
VSLPAPSTPGALVRLLRHVGTFLADLRIALRTLLRAPGFFALTSTVLALGIAVVVVMFATLRVVLGPPPLDRIDRVFSLTEENAALHERDRWIPLADLQAWSREQRSFEAIAGFAWEAGTLKTDDGVSQGCPAARVAGPFFELLRVRPLRGRVLGADDARPGAAPVAVISERLWRDTFAADPRMVGRSVKLNGFTYTVVGVVPAALDLPVTALLWYADQTETVGKMRVAGPWLHPIGRLRDGVTPAAAEAELQAMQARRAESLPELAGDRPRVRPLSLAWVDSGFQSLLRVLFGAIGLVLLLACVNAAGLLLVRGAGRMHEAAVRRALGAGRFRLAGQMLAETAVIGAAATLLGLILAFAAQEVLRRVLPVALPTAPAWWHVEMDWTTIGFAVGIAAAATALAGLYPALRTASVSIDPLLREGLRDTGLRSARLVRWLVVAEIALSAGMVTAAGLVVSTAARMRDGDVGVSTSGFLVAYMELPRSRYPSWPDFGRFLYQLGPRLKAIPGAEAAAVTSAPPGCTSYWRERYAPADRSFDGIDQLPMATMVAVDDGFFDAFRVPVRSGRALGAQDQWQSQRTLVLNAALARSLWPEGSAIGKVIAVAPQLRIPPSTVVGVVNDLRHDTRFETLGSTPATIYLPLLQWPTDKFYLLVRGPRDPMILAEGVRRAVESLDPDLRVFSVRTLDQQRVRNAAGLTLVGSMFAAFGAVALLLAAAGVYSVLSYSVTQGAREIAIRRALGAPDGAIVRAVVARAAVQLVLGLLAGVAITPLIKLVVGTPLGQQEHPLAVYLQVAALMAGCLGASLLVPLWRALRLQPSAALRHS